MRFRERMFTRASAISVVSIFRTPLPNINSLRPRWHHRRIRVYYSSIGLQSLVLVGSSTSCYRITHRKIRISVSARARLNAVSILLVCTLSVIDLAMMRIRLLADIHWPSHGHFCRDPSFREVRLASWDSGMDTLSPSCERSPLPEVHLVWPLGMKVASSHGRVVLLSRGRG